MFKELPCSNEYHLSTRKLTKLLSFIQGSNIDSGIVRRNGVDKVRETRATRGADCGTDHVILRSRMMINRKMQCNKSGSKPPSILGTDSLKYPQGNEKLSKKLMSFQSTEMQKMISNKNWKGVKEKVYSTASRVLRKQTRKNQGWFYEHDANLLQLIMNRDKARQVPMQCNTRLKTGYTQEHRATFIGIPNENQIMEGKSQGVADCSRQEDF